MYVYWYVYYYTESQDDIASTLISITVTMFVSRRLCDGFTKIREIDNSSRLSKYHVKWCN